MSNVMKITRSELEVIGPIGTLEAYTQRVCSIPPLTREEEVDLAKRLTRHNDLDAARKLILPHLRLVVHAARRYTGYGLPMADLIQEGNIGLMKAVNRFDPSVGVRLATYAKHWIRAEIHEYLYRNWRIVKVVTTKAQRKLFFKLRGAKKRLGWLSSVETSAIARNLGVDAKDVRQMEQRLYSCDLHLDPLADSSNGHTDEPLSASLQNPGPDPSEQLANSHSRNEGLSHLRTALLTLDERSRDILTCRWLQEDKSTLQKLAHKYGVSAERIRQIEANAIKHLQSRLIDAGETSVQRHPTVPPRTLNQRRTPRIDVSSEISDSDGGHVGHS
jgi:RNA polymerase sigma-32 factor